MTQGGTFARWRERRRDSRNLMVMMAVQTLNDSGAPAWIQSVQALIGGTFHSVGDTLADLEERGFLLGEFEAAAGGQARRRLYKVVHDGRVEMSRLAAKAITRSLTPRS